MKPIQVSQDVVPLADFKSQSASWLERIRSSGQPIIITQNGKAAAVMISPAEFDRIQGHDAERVRSEIRLGEAAIEAGKLYSTDEVKAHLETRRRLIKK